MNNDTQANVISNISTDEPTDEDILCITNYTEGLSSFISECPTPMTIAIQGDWGSGKTSVMKMVAGQLQNDIHTVWLNTWMFSQFDTGINLSKSLILAMLKGFNIADGENEENDNDVEDGKQKNPDSIKKVKLALNVAGNLTKSALVYTAGTFGGGLLASILQGAIGRHGFYN